ncbi:Uncharacterised protein [Mycobacteroides abscessus]|nr:Uncharacterised protein [Mycobacteroides abscessus]
MAFTPLVGFEAPIFTEVMATVELDWHWATRTGGAVSTAQRRALLGRLIRALPGMVSDAVKTRVGRRGLGRVEFGSIVVPDSTLARAARAGSPRLCHPTRARALVSHLFLRQSTGRAG